MKRIVYLDHAAATPVDKRVLKAMQPYFADIYGNPSSLHMIGKAAKDAITAARVSIAKLMNAHEDEILFTSGGTESDNLAITGIVRAPAQRRAVEAMGSIKPHVIASAIEHHAVLEPLLHLQKTGEIDLTLLPVDRAGLVSVEDLVAAFKPETILVSIIFASNEIGTLQPLSDIGRAILAWRKEHKTIYPLLHSDACQAAGYLELNVEKLHVDLLTLNASKIYGPKGIGMLFVRRNVKLAPSMIGGGQERNLRSGTENVPGIIGLAKALEIAQAKREGEVARLLPLRDRLTEGLLKIPKSVLNGHQTERLPNSVNISFLDIEGEAAVLYLDAKGIMVSTGSACASTSLEPSHVILATGLSYEAAHGSLRFTLGRSTNKRDVDYVLKSMPAIVERLRKMSPVNLDAKYFVR